MKQQIYRVKNDGVTVYVPKDQRELPEGMQMRLYLRGGDVETYADIRLAALRADEISASRPEIVGWVEDVKGAVVWGFRPDVLGGMPKDQKVWKCPRCTVRNLAPSKADPYLGDCPVCGEAAVLIDVPGNAVLTAAPY